jgi:hypothetical protein
MYCLQQEGQRRGMPLAQLLREEGLAQPLREVIMYALACIGTSQERPCRDAGAAAPAAAIEPGEHLPASSAHDRQQEDSTSAAGQAHAPESEHEASLEALQAGGSSRGHGVSKVSTQQQQQQERYAAEQASTSGRAQGNEGLVSTEEGLAALGQYLASAGRHASFFHLSLPRWASSVQLALLREDH